MGRIQRLSALEAQKIAAGEVVERPANVVKELIENASDAGATAIVVELEDAGKKSIIIHDNGSGMDEHDARLSIEQFTTSKISSVDDLTTVTTFGFRGEALASIAAVSTMTLITKQSDAPSALKLTIANGSIMHETQCAHNTGTTITVANLFHTIPARQKFLKKRETEWNQISHFLYAFCLSHCTVSVTAIHDKNVLMNVPCVTSLRDRCAQLWGVAVVQNLIAIQADHETCSLSIHGFVSDHQHARYDRSGIFFFVNNRWIKNTTLMRSLLNAYQNVLPQGRYPSAAIFITIDTHEIDVNIHPRKEEIQFLHPRIAETFLQDTVKQALEQQIGSQEKKTSMLPASMLPDGSIQRMHYHAFSQHNTQKSTQHHESMATMAKLNAHEVSHFLAPAQHTQPVDAIIDSSLHTDSLLIGQYAKTYILIERSTGLWLIDQHAAHERILYERFAQQSAPSASVRLIVPQVITISRDQLAYFEPHLDLLRTNGFEVDKLRDDQLLVSATPVHAKNLSIDELVRQCISWKHEYQSYEPSRFATILHHHIRAQMACKAAVKAGDELSREAMAELLTDLEKTPNKLTCPHGRPTSWLINAHDIEKKFKRKN